MNFDSTEEDKIMCEHVQSVHTHTQTPLTYTDTSTFPPRSSVTKKVQLTDDQQKQKLKAEQDNTDPIIYLPHPITHTHTHAFL